MGIEQKGRAKKMSCEVMLEIKSHKMMIPRAYEKNRRQNRKASATTLTVYTKIVMAYSLVSSASCCRLSGSAGCGWMAGSICRGRGGGGAIVSSSASEPL